MRALGYVRNDRRGHWSSFDARGQLHRDDGLPAVIWDVGTERWYTHGQPHREGAPAAICPDGTQEWCFEGLRHREDGPAVERASRALGVPQYWIKNKRLWPAEFRRWASC